MAATLPIPAELRERPPWVLWRYDERDGKPTKVPSIAAARAVGKLDQLRDLGHLRPGGGDAPRGGRDRVRVHERDPFTGENADHSWVADAPHSSTRIRA